MTVTYSTINMNKSFTACTCSLEDHVKKYGPSTRPARCAQIKFRLISVFYAYKVEYENNGKNSLQVSMKISYNYRKFSEYFKQVVRDFWKCRTLGLNSEECRYIL